MTIKTLEEACALMRKNELANAADTIVCGYGMHDSICADIDATARFQYASPAKDFVELRYFSQHKDDTYNITQSADIPDDAIMFTTQGKTVAMVRNGKLVDINNSFILRRSER